MMSRSAISLGASFLGYATHAGFLCQLRDRGYAPSHVAGSSAGALAAGLYAAGLDTETIRRTVTGAALRWSFVRRTFWGVHFTRSMVWSRQPSCFNTRGAVEYLESILGKRRIEDLTAARLTIGLADLETRRSRLVAEGPLAEAMVASCCVPFLLAPTQFEGQRYFDGGVSHEAPVDQWFQSPEVDRIIVHRIRHAEGRVAHSFPGNLFALTGAAHEVISDQLMTYRQQLAGMHGKAFQILQTEHAVPSLFARPSHMEGLFALGQQQADLLIDSHGCLARHAGII